MSIKPCAAFGALLTAMCAVCSPANAADSELDALDLKSAAVEADGQTPKSGRLLIEVAAGLIDQRHGLGRESLRRASIDFFHASSPAPGWRAVVSNRLDHLKPSALGIDETFNSLREAYIGVDFARSQAVVEFGRINLRQGPSYGFNPTDFFRDGALRGVVSVNPFAMRENRLGTVMIRGQRLWDGGSVALSFSPKLANRASQEGLSLDFGATNNRHRSLLTLSHQLSNRVSGQLLLYKDKGLPVQIGANLTALVNDSIVAHGEWAQSRAPKLADQILGGNGQRIRGNRSAGGLTYTTDSKLSITGEVQINEFAMTQGEWRQAVAADPRALGVYLFGAEQKQDLAARQAYLVYATQKSLGWKSLDLSAFVRFNAKDLSRMSWLELRYHWQNVDAAIQWQQTSGRPTSQFGATLERQVIQFVTSYHFQ